MWHYAVEVMLSAGIIVAVAEVARFNVTFGALIKSLPLVSIFAMIWLYVNTQNTGKIAELSTGMFWLVLPALLKHGLGFYSSLAISVAVMTLCCAAAVPLLARFGIQI